MSKIETDYNHPMATRPPGKFEFDLLQFLSNHDGLSVRQIFELFGKPRGFIRGTIVKSVDRLLKKGLVEREMADETFLYRTRENAEDMERRLVEAFIKERLGGRLKPIASFLAQAEDIDPSELEQFKKLLDHGEPQIS